MFYKNKFLTNTISKTDIAATLLDINNKLGQLILKKTDELYKANNDLRKEVNVHRQTILKLCESEERFKTIFDVAPAAIIIHEGTTTFFLNSYAKRILGCSDKKKIWSYLEQSEKDRLHRRFENILQTQKSSELYQITILKGSTCVKLEVMTGLITLDDKVCFISIALDKSDRAILEKEIENSTDQIAQNKSEELRKKVKNATFKEMEFKAIGQQLHNNVGQYISALSLRCAELETRIRNRQSVTLEDVKGLHEICIATSESLHDLTQLFFLKAGDLKSDKDTIQDLCFNICKYFYIDIRFDVDSYYLPTNLFARNHVIQFLQEALTNAAKYSGKKLIKLSILQSDDLIVYRISDNGQGFDTSLARRGMGLKLMQFNADELAADFHIKSDNQGTVITLKLPLHINFI